MEKDVGVGSVNAGAIQLNIQWNAPYITYRLQEFQKQKMEMDGTRIISFLFKKGVRPLTNYRPMKLLNSVYKFRATIYARWLAQISNLLTCESKRAKYRRSLYFQSRGNLS